MKDRAVPDQPSQMEIALNDALAELQFFRVALQVFFINVVGHSPEPAATLHAMEGVVRALARLPIEPQTAQGDQRRKAMVLAHAEAFFAHLQALAEEVQRKRSGDAPN